MELLTKVRVYSVSLYFIDISDWKADEVWYKYKEVEKYCVYDYKCITELQKILKRKMRQNVKDIV